MAIEMARKGFDVWLGNNRGTKYSLDKTKLQDKNYWDFSFDKMGRYDLTRSIDFILEQTTAKKLTYIGHSIGNTQMFYALS